MDLTTLQNWLWEAACSIRGAVDAPKFKDYILPLIFLKRLSDVFEDEVAYLVHEFGNVETATRLVEQQHRLVRFYLPPEARWGAIRQRTTGLGQYLTDVMRAVARENPKLQGVIDAVDFNATTAGQRIIDDAPLARLIEILSKHRLGLNDVEPDILGRAYEYLLRKFAEGQGQSAGEFYTPREVAILLARILEPKPGMTVYDPCCGSGGLLIKCHLRLLETHGVRQNGRLKLPRHLSPLKVFGQERVATTFAMARMNAFLHDIDAEIAAGDTMVSPAFRTEDGRLEQFDLVAANPMWNQKFPAATYEHDPYDRFQFGTPPASSADWGWIQHMYASLRDGGRMAVVLDTGAVSRGSGNQGSNRERDIRKAFVERDLIEAVILLPENLFYNTTAPAIILVINKAKKHPGEILLINASRLFVKGRPKNYLSEEHVERIATVYHDWTPEEGFATLISNEEAEHYDYNLSPNRYVTHNGREEILSLEEAVVRLQQAEEERAAADCELQRILDFLGLGGAYRG